MLGRTVYRTFAVSAASGCLNQKVQQAEADRKNKRDNDHKQIGHFRNLHSEKP